MSTFYSSKYKKTYWEIGFCMHIEDDKEYILLIRNIVKELFNRETNLKYRLKYNAIDFRFRHKSLLKKLNKDLNFPIGKKTGLNIADRFLDDMDSMKYITRGLFDTDGSIYFDKDKRYKTPYPIVDISTISKPLREQLAKALKKPKFQCYQIQKRHKNKRAFAGPKVVYRDKSQKQKA